LECSQTITIRFVVPGFHCWPDAPDRRSYLRERHRHLFHIEVTTPVEHRERQIEFHDLLDEARELFPPHDHNSASCETMAHYLATSLHKRHGERPFTVSVFEDGEAGATVRVAPSQ
jgi:hypothetical protein